MVCRGQGSSGGVRGDRWSVGVRGAEVESEGSLVCRGQGSSGGVRGDRWSVGVRGAEVESEGIVGL